MQFPTVGIKLNDVILFSALLFLMMDMQPDWENYGHCERPIHKWLLGSYVSVLVFRFVHILGAHLNHAATESSDFLLDMRHKNIVPWLVMHFTWIVALPFFTLWAFVGTKWLWAVGQHTPQCLPDGQRWWFLILWLLVGYLWVGIHLGLAMVAWALELRVRRAERRLRHVEDADSEARWGRMGELANRDALSMLQDKCMEPEEIKALPLVVATADTQDCSICLGEVNAGESVRMLSACGHTFHRGCIDLWLVRCAACPLCKRSAKPEVDP